MLQVLQSLSDGTVELADVPVPAVGATSVVVATRTTVVSAGTERMLLQFGRASILEKARQQPDKVKQTLDKIRTDGLGPTLEAVRSKLGTPIALGYCQAGVVTEVGRSVSMFRPGDRVVTNGPHAEYVRVPQTLAARIPDGLAFEAAAFAPVAAIALNGLRLANPTLGETVVVVGLGLIGQLAVQLVRAAGCKAIGLDTDPARVQLAREFGADGIVVGQIDAVDAVLSKTGGVGADAVLLALATDSDGPVHDAAQMARKRGRLVLVGVTGLNLRRDDFYKKELSFQVACSYGPGRYDPQHEEAGIDYPAAYVRWTEARNFAAALDLMATGRLDPLRLVSHRFPVAEVARAYEVVTGQTPSLGIVLNYPESNVASERGLRTVSLRGASSSRTTGCRIGFIGAGNFAARVLAPAFAKAGAVLEVVASAGGTSAAVVGRELGFRRATTDTSAVFADENVDAVVIATRHDSHGTLTAEALRANKSVFVEKPLAVSETDLQLVRVAAQASSGLLCVGFNRRFAPMVARLAREASQRNGPMAVNITVNAGAIPPDHWTQDPSVGGGRIVGEGCHFIDLARFLVGAAIADVQVASARRGAAVVEDVANITLAFRDGSIASIQYLANGHRAFPKERVEVFFDGKIARIDNFRRCEGWGLAFTSRLPRSQDKGHGHLVAEFIRSLKGERPPPIPMAELLEVADVTVTAAALAACRERAP